MTTPLLTIAAAVFGLLLGWPLVLLANRFRREPSPQPRLPTIITASTATAAAFLLLSVTVPPGPFLVACLLFAAGGVTLSVVDVAEKRLPNRLLGAVALVVGLALSVATVLSGDLPDAGRALAGAAALFAIYLALALLARGALGMGDVKLAPLVGLLPAYESWTGWLVALVAGFLLHAVVSLIALALRRASRRSMLPMGPAMVAAAVLAVAFV